MYINKFIYCFKNTKNLQKVALEYKKEYFFAIPNIQKSFFISFSFVCFIKNQYLCNDMV